MWWLRIRNIFTREETRTGKSGAKTGKGPVPEAPVKERQWLWPLVMGVALLAWHLFLFPPVPRLGVDFPGRGEIAERKITAEFTFEAPRLDSDIETDRNTLAGKEPPVLLRASQGSGPTPESRLELWLDAFGAQLADTSTAVEDKIANLQLQFRVNNPDILRQLFASEEPDSLIQRMNRVGRKVLQGGVVDRLPTGQYDKVVIKTPGFELRKSSTDVVLLAGLERKLLDDLMTAGMGPASAAGAANVMRSFITSNLFYSSEQTLANRERARQSVPTKRTFDPGEKIIDQGERVNEEQAQFLNHLADLNRERGGGDTTDRLTRSFVRALLVVMALGLFAWLGKVHFLGEIQRARSVVTLGVILGVYLAGASFVLDRPAIGALGVPIVLLSLLTTVLFRDKVGYVNTLLAVALLSVLPDVKAMHVFSWFILGMVTVISVRRIRKRSQFYRTILLLTFLSVILIFLENVGVTHGGNAIYLAGFFAPGLLVMFGMFLLPVVEPLVGVCSDLTLLELSDLNHPLLQRMALEAQGTYHHSQVVGQLAEHAARAIDANSLLTRVGALFHDIGKMQKSEYFVENQSLESNKHDELSPSMSALVIAAHVKEGIELGRKWRLPQAVIDFIPEHHGTMVMEYFYHKALNSEDSSPVAVDDFRYPGPKPHCRETAILMLADAVEAATRSLAKPTPSRIREITKQIIDKRMLSGELDNSGLTLSDLARIRESFIPLLTGIHHSRIVYPGQKEREADRVPERRGDRKARP